MTWHVSTFYFFSSLGSPSAFPESLQRIEQEIHHAGEKAGIKGLFILGPEGLNSTFAAPSPEASQLFQEWLKTRFQQPNLWFKESRSEIQPFLKLKIKIRREIVTAGAPDLLPQETHHRHLSPEEWDQVLEEEKDIAVIDTRNSYEYRIGTFRGAIDPQIDQFTDFPDFIDQQKYPKDKKILIFCTGGIRCEKGILELERRGYNQVFQLQGGILNYLAKRPHRNWLGECFVFDQRVALTQELQPTSTFALCPHCGDPGEVEITCARCDHSTKICPVCAEKEIEGKTCSKNCRHHFSLSPGKKGDRQVPLWQKKD